MRLFFVFSIFLLFSGTFSLQAQTADAQKADELLNQKARCLESAKSDVFYYIQIYNGKDIAKAKSILQDFIRKYPNSKAFVKWENPEYKVWTGEYLTKFEVERDMQIIRE
jgi:TolA-binding protein